MPTRNENNRTRLSKEGARPVRRRRTEAEQAKYEAYMRARAIRRRRGIAGLILLTAVLVGLILFLFSRRSYHSYQTTADSSREDVISNNYAGLGNHVLKYGRDGIVLQNKKLEVLWEESYSMNYPILKVNGKYAVVADQDGTDIQIFNRKGRIGMLKTSYPIVKVCVSSRGMVGAILDGGDTAWINFYNVDGSLIAENQTRIDDPGYPMDAAISENGMIMMVAYQYVDGSQTTSYVAFYNFGEAGRNEANRIVSAFTYEGVVIPDVVYLDGNRCAAIREDGFTLYSGSQVPKELATIQTQKEIVSVFYDESQIGLVFQNDDKNKNYTMEVYNKDGKLQFTKDFNIPYTTICKSKGYILLYNSSQICVMNEKGTIRYEGTIEESLQGLYKIGLNRYLMIAENGVSVVKFK